MPDHPTASASDTREDFPSYADWLSRHDDETLIDLLWRLRAFHTGSATGSGTTAVLGAVTDIAALRRLTALDLAVLQALVIAGAAIEPVSLDEVTVELDELFGIADTPDDRRPDDAAVTRTVQSLAGWGLVFGPTLSLSGSSSSGDPGGSGDSGNSGTSVATGTMMVPSHMPPLFAGSTDIPWVLVDGYRCPVPSEELPATLESLPTRQRRLLDTLEASGGIGHSATLNDPERPLAKMIAAGLLDQVDDQTARLSPRVSAAITGRIIPSPGGDFRMPGSTGTATATAQENQENQKTQKNQENQENTDAAAVCRVVETVRAVTDLVQELGHSPLRPLNAGGVGVREISRVAKSLEVTPESVTDTLLFCRHADLVGRGIPLPTPQGDLAPGEQWGVTERGARFLSAPLARRWAILLDGWRASSHAPWLAEGSQDAHLLEESIDLPRAAALRGVISHVIADVSTASGTPADTLWRIRPSVAALTEVEALDGVLTEAVGLGLVDQNVPSSAACALARIGDEDPDSPEDVLTAALDDLLPDPVSMLIIQADMTILAPGLLDTDTERMLQQFAEVESTGMASVWRVTRESMERAVETGLTAEDIQSFLAGMAPEVPQTLSYLIHDTFRTHHPVEPVVATTASSVLTAPDEETMATLMASEAADEVGLHQVAPTVAVSSTQLSHVIEALDEDGATVRIAGSGGGTGTVMHTSPRSATVSVVPDPQRPVPSRDEVNDQLAGSVEAFRRARQRDAEDNDEPGAGTTGDGVTVHEPQEIMAALRHAYDQGTQVEINYVNASGSAVREWISVVTMSPVAIVGVTEAGGESLRIQPHRVASVTS